MLRSFRSKLSTSLDPSRAVYVRAELMWTVACDEWVLTETLWLEWNVYRHVSVSRYSDVLVIIRVYTWTQHPNNIILLLLTVESLLFVFFSFALFYFDGIHACAYPRFSHTKISHISMHTVEKEKVQKKYLAKQIKLVLIVFNIFF